jgi:hypothetical protein
MPQFVGGKFALSGQILLEDWVDERSRRDKTEDLQRFLIGIFERNFHSNEEALNRLRSALGCASIALAVDVVLWSVDIAIT